MTRSDPSSLKREAAARALEFVTSGMTLGLGTGSTAEAFLELLGPKVQAGLDVVGVPTSQRTAQKARALGIPLVELDAAAPLEMTVDGADEADRDLNLIKGGGGALLREKIVAASSKRMVVIADGSKLVERLGAFPLPVEIVPFGMKTTLRRIEAAIAALGYAGVTLAMRGEGPELFRTDSGNLIVDCSFGAIGDAPALARALGGLTGVVDHGLFIGIASALVIARPDGVEVIERTA
jgi:ribose 5-phosphate isomerase A